MILNGKELSPRQEQIARLIADGKTGKEIAAAVGIEYGTVKLYLGKLYRKLGFPANCGSAQVKLAKLVWSQTDPVRCLQAMAAEANRTLQP